jgi:hypothetical protein
MSSMPVPPVEAIEDGGDAAGDVPADIAAPPAAEGAAPDGRVNKRQRVSCPGDPQPDASLASVLVSLVGLAEKQVNLLSVHPRRLSNAIACAQG